MKSQYLKIPKRMKCPGCDEKMRLVELGDPEINDSQISEELVTVSIAVPIVCVECNSDAGRITWEVESFIPATATLEAECDS